MVKLIPEPERASMGAIVELARELARTVDADSGGVTAALASTYRAVLNDLRNAVVVPVTVSETPRNGRERAPYAPAEAGDELDAFIEDWRPDYERDGALTEGL